MSDIYEQPEERAIKLLQQAHKASLRRQREIALDLSQQAYELAPENLVCALYYASMLVENGKHEESQKISHLIIKKNPENCSVYIYLGRSLNAQQKFVEAEASWRKAVSLCGEQTDGIKSLVHSKLGYSLMMQNKFSLAANYYYGAIAFRPDHISAYACLSECLYGQGEFKKSEEKAQDLLKLATQKDDESLISEANDLIKQAQLAQRPSNDSGWPFSGTELQ